MRCGWLLWGLGLLACQPQRELALPGPPGSTLVLIAEGPQLKAAVLTDAQAMPFDARFGRGVDGRLWALYYSLPPERLGLTPGVLEMSRTGGLRRRHLIPPSRAQIAAWSEDAFGDWKDADPTDLKRILDELYVSSPAPEACASAGGCFLNAMDQASEACGLPCPPSPVTPPAPPDPPALGLPACASGWPVEVRDTGASPESVSICRPPAGLECPSDQFQGFEGRCEALGTPCPGGLWAPAPTDRRSLYVRPAAPSGGDGTQARPFGSLPEALMVARSGDALILGPGVHHLEGPLLIPDLLLLGSCVGRSSLEAGPSGPVVEIGAGPVELRDLTVQSADPEAIRVGPGTELQLSGVAVRSSARDQPAIRVEVGARLRADHVLVRSATTGIELGGQLELAQGTLLAEQGAGLQVHPGASFALSTFRIRAPLGLSSREASSGTLNNGLFEGSAGWALDSEGAAQLQLRGVFLLSGGLRIDRTPKLLLDGLGAQGRGLEIANSEGALHRLQISDVASVGLTVTRSTLEVTELLVSRSQGFGVHVIDAQLSLSEVVVLDSQPGLGADPAAEGHGVEFLATGSEPIDARLSRLLVVRSAGSGVLQRGPGTMVGNDWTVDDTQGGVRADDAAVYLGSAGELAELTRIAIHRTPAVGLWLQAPIQRGEVQDLEVEGSGIGLRITGVAGAWPAGAQVQLDRAVIRNSGLVGLCVGSSAEMVATSVQLLDTGLQTPGPADFCVPPTGFNGTGLAVGSNANLSLSRFDIRGHEVRAVHLLPLGHLELEDGIIGDSPLAIDALGTELLDFMRGVEFRNVGTILAR